MWKHKNTENIIYIDIEKKLERKPTIFADNTNTPFLSEIFDTIFYDPPHQIRDTGSYFVYPDAARFRMKWKGYGKIPRYYGGDKFKTKTALIAHIYYAQKEFMRILKNDGLLWLKWNDIEIPLRRILILFEDWNEMLRHYVKSPIGTGSKHQTYWICFSKRKMEDVQTTLL
jgi:hypothetical protein